MSGGGVTPHLSLQQGFTPVQADRIQLHAVIHNLLVNAADALETLPPAQRKLSISVRRQDGNAILAVDDSGPGVAPRGGGCQPRVASSSPRTAAMAASLFTWGSWSSPSG